MALDDYIKSEYVIEHGAHVFVVRRPTVATVLLFVELYAKEIGTLVDLHKAGDLDTSDRRALSELVIGQVVEQSGGRVERILSTCVDIWQGRPGGLGAVLESASGSALVATLSRAVLAQCNLDRVVDSLDLDQLETSSRDGSVKGAERRPSILDDMPTAQEVALTRVAREFHCRPDTVTDWPYELWLSVMAALIQVGRADEAPATEAPPMLEANSIAGLGVVKV